MPLMCAGDFNDLLQSDEKQGGAIRPNWMYAGFREAILNCNLLDVELTGHIFTWSKSRGANNLLEERLDRAMGNPG